MTHRTRIVAPAWGAASALALCASLAGAQTPKGAVPAPTQPPPTYRTLSPEVMKAMYGDAVDPQSPVPGLTYTPHQMAKRLMEIAEGPVPTREALEQEFGFRFRMPESKLAAAQGVRLYYATAPSPPFARPIGPMRTNVTYDALKKSVHISFYFERDKEGFNEYTSIRKYCTPKSNIITTLKNSWMRHQGERDGRTITVEYTTISYGIERKVAVFPIEYHPDICLGIFSIEYITRNSSEH